MDRETFDRAEKIIKRIEEWKKYDKNLRNNIWAVSPSLDINKEIEPMRQLLYNTTSRYIAKQIVELKLELENL